MFEYKQTEILIPYKEGDLYGILFTPEANTEKFPCVICSHGIFSSYQMTVPSAEELAKRGFISFCFDFRGCSYSRKSGGDLLSCSVLTEENELRAVIDWIIKQENIDDKQIYLLGQSMGGAVSVLAGAAEQEKVAGMIFMYPALNMKDFISATLSDTNNFPEVVENFLGVSGLDLGKKFFIDALNAPFNESIQDFKKPVIILHGNNDKLVPISYGESLAKNYHNAEFIMVEGGEHGFNLNTELADKVAQFLVLSKE